jgi:hypothetical protein
MWPASAWCLSVGDAQVLSRFGQPLDVQIPIELSTASEIDNADSLNVRILPSSDPTASDAGLPLLSLDGVRIQVSGTGGHYIVHLSSASAVMEPVGVLTLDIQADGTRFVREIPLIFDLAPPAQRNLAVEPATAIRADVVPVPPVQGPRPRAAEASPQVVSRPSSMAAQTPPAFPAAIPHHLHSHRAHPEIPMQTAAASPAPEVPQLQHFQLAPRFDSYIELAAAGTAPWPVTTASLAIAAAPVPALIPEPRTIPIEAVANNAAEPAARPVSTPAAPPQAVEESDSGWSLPNWRWWLAAVLLLLAFTRKSRVGGINAATAIKPVLPQPRAAQAEPEGAVFVAAPANTAIRPATAPPLRLAVQAAPQIPQQPASAEAENLRQRLVAVSCNRGGAQSDPWLMVVEAHLDLGRLDAAEKVLSELEAANAPVRPRVTLVKG